MAGAEQLAALLREAEALKARLEEERQKLNDVTLSSVAERLEPVSFPSLKPRRVLKGHQAKVLCCDWAPDKRHIASSSQDGKVIIWDAFTATKEQTFSLPTTWLLALAYAPSGNMVATGGLDNKITVFPVGGGEEEGGAGVAAAGRKRTVATSTAYMSCCVFPGSARQLAAGGGDGSCALWDVEAGALLTAFSGHRADVAALDAAPALLDTLASGGGDRAVLVWDARSGHKVHTFEGHESDVCGVRFHPGGDALAAGGDDASVRVFDLRADRQLAEFRRPAQLFACTSVEWSPSGRLLLAGYGDGTCAAWDALRGTRLAVLCGHEHRVAGVRRAPDGTALATASWDTTTRIWA